MESPVVPPNPCKIPLGYISFIWFCKSKVIEWLQSGPILNFVLFYYVSTGFHRHLCWGDVCQADCHGSLLLLPGGLELLWWFHCDPEFGWAGTGWCGGSFSSQVFPIGEWKRGKRGREMCWQCLSIYYSCEMNVSDVIKFLSPSLAEFKPWCSFVNNKTLHCVF